MRATIISECVTWKDTWKKTQTNEFNRNYNGRNCEGKKMVFRMTVQNKYGNITIKFIIDIIPFIWKRMFNVQ